MDPDITLTRIRLLAEAMLEIDEAHALAEMVQDLDEWLSSGGFKPSDWA